MSGGGGDSGAGGWMKLDYPFFSHELWKMDESWALFIVKETSLGKDLD